MDKYKLYRRYRKLFGEHAQSMVSMEECGEYIQALSKYNRGSDDYKSVLEEIADMFVTCEQVLLNIADNHGYVADETMLMVENIMEKKRTRMAKRIGERYDAE